MVLKNISLNMELSWLCVLREIKNKQVTRWSSFRYLLLHNVYINPYFNYNIIDISKIFSKYNDS